MTMPSFSYIWYLIGGSIVITMLIWVSQLYLYNGWYSVVDSITQVTV